MCTGACAGEVPRPPSSFITPSMSEGCNTWHVRGRAVRDRERDHLRLEVVGLLERLGRRADAGLAEKERELESWRAELDVGACSTFVLPSHRLSFCVPAPVVRILDLHPPALVRPVATRHALGDDTLQAQLAHGALKRRAVLERLRSRPCGAVEPQPLKPRPAARCMAGR
jgi:hypothetical protein